MGVVVENGALFNECRKIGLSPLVHALIKVSLSLVELNFLHVDCQSWELQVTGTLGFGPPQHCWIQNINSELQHRCGPRAAVSASCDWVQHILVEVTAVHHWAVPAVNTKGPPAAKLPVKLLATTPFGTASVVGVRVVAKKLDQTKEL